MPRKRMKPRISDAIGKGLNLNDVSGIIGSKNLTSDINRQIKTIDAILTKKTRIKRRFKPGKRK